MDQTSQISQASERDPSVDDGERLARVALNRLAEPGDVRFAHLAAEIGCVRLYDLLREQRDLNGMSDDVAVRLTDVDPVRELEQAARLGLRFVMPGDAEWPHQLDDLAQGGSLNERGGVPLGLWVKGPVRLDQLAGSVSVVGSRASTSYGSAVAEEIAATAAEAGVPVVSGAAFGVDVAAHRGAIGVDAAPTVAVLACGADRVYPVAHRSLIEHLARHGAVVSEAPPGCSPQRVRFLARNRIIAAISRGTVVVEAASRSGALNTANWASRLNRVLLGVPGPITSAQSVGVHEQIRCGAMSLVTGGSDVLEMIGGSGDHLTEPVRSPDTVRDRLSGRAKQVLDAVPVGTGADAVSIARVAGLGVLEVRTSLARLEDLQLVAMHEGRWRLDEAAR